MIRKKKRKITEVVGACWCIGVIFKKNYTHNSSKAKMLENQNTCWCIEGTFWLLFERRTTIIICLESIALEEGNSCIGWRHRCMFDRGVHCGQGFQKLGGVFLVVVIRLKKLSKAYIYIYLGGIYW